MLNVEVRAADLTSAEPVDNYTSLVYIQNWMEAGSWVLTIPTAAQEVASLLAAGGGIVVRDGDVVDFSGPADTGPDGLTVIRREITANDNEESDTLVVTGSDDMVWLADRLAHPSPLDDNPASADYDVNTGPASSVVWDYVNDNCGPAAVAARQVIGLTMAADPEVGVSMTQMARWQNLLDFLHDVAVQGGVTVSSKQVGRSIVVTVSETSDLSAAVVLSPRYGDLADVVYEITRSSATAIYMGGQGDLSARATSVAVVPGVRRVEQFADRRDVDDSSQLDDLVAAALVDATGTTSLTITPSDTDSFQYGRDYQLGDLIKIDLDGNAVTARVQSVKTTLDASGKTRVIGVGDVTNPMAVLYGAIRSLSKRVTQLERI